MFIKNYHFSGNSSEREREDWCSQEKWNSDVGRESRDNFNVVSRDITVDKDDHNSCADDTDDMEPGAEGAAALGSFETIAATD